MGRCTYVYRCRRAAPEATDKISGTSRRENIIILYGLMTNANDKQNNEQFQFYYVCTKKKIVIITIIVYNCGYKIAVTTTTLLRIIVPIVYYLYIVHIYNMRLQ